MPPLPRPSDGELAILRVLWDLGASTVRDIHGALYPDGGTGYNTTLKFLQIMMDKGLVERDDRSRQHVYRVAQEEGVTQRHLIADLVARAFSGNATALVMRALEAQPATDSELDEIQQLLDHVRRTRKA